ncbi:MAG: RDD family protein [Lacinutrix sp.]|uniref:RDD family protein n=1 Tax=Lacinutrix sp. TaxID=1937692 RepID=UPI0030B284F6
MVNFKSFWVYLIIILLSITYKPYFESKYNTTIGKMLLKLEVTDWDYNYISLKKSFLRSLIIIIPSIIYIPAHYFAFNNAYILDSNGFLEFSTKMTETYPMFMLIVSVLSYVSLADVIVYLIDLSKKQRSLKDYIAKTYVVKKSESIND